MNIYDPVFYFSKIESNCRKQQDDKGTLMNVSPCNIGLQLDIPPSCTILFQSRRCIVYKSWCSLKFCSESNDTSLQP